MKTLHATLGALMALGAAMAPLAGASAAYPDKTVRLILPFPPGGSADTLARMLADRLKDRTGATFVVENKPGASANLGTDYVAKADPDGYTILVGVTGALSINPTLYPDLGYVPDRDFQGISMMATAPVVIAASPQSGITTVKELVEQAKRKPDALSYATNGVGTSHQLAGELFNHTAGIKVRNVPYKGTPAALQDIAGGRVELGFVDLTATLPMVAGDRVKAVATTGSQRSPALPDVPTVRESGYPDYEALTWIGLFAPKGMKAEDVETLSGHVNAVLAEPDMQEKARGYGLEVQGSSPADLQAFLVSENQKWRKVIQDAGIKLQ